MNVWNCYLCVIAEGLPLTFFYKQYVAKGSGSKTAKKISKVLLISLNFQKLLTTEAFFHSRGKQPLN